MFANVGKFANLERADLVVRSTRPALTETTMERRMAAPTQARVREYFNYEQDTGRLVFLERPRSEFDAPGYARHLKLIGKEAGHLDLQGYRCVIVDGRSQKAHKVAWLWMTGEWPFYPDYEVDHINRDRSDNRWKNLRKVTKSENQRNANMRSTNKSGVHGVNWVESKQKWVARIWNGPRHVCLGHFDDLDHAAIARQAAERVLGFKPAKVGR